MVRRIDIRDLWILQFAERSFVNSVSVTAVCNGYAACADFAFYIIWTIWNSYLEKRLPHQFCYFRMIEPFGKTLIIHSHVVVLKSRHYSCKEHFKINCPIYLAKLWISWGIKPTLLCGHSVGEYVAAQLAGVFNLEDAYELKDLLESEANYKELNHDDVSIPKQEAKHHYSMSFKEILLISITSLYFLAFIPLAISGYFRLDDFFEIEAYTDTIVNLIKASYILIAFIILGAFIVSFIAGLVITYLKYGKYKVTSNEERIFIEKGILSTSNFSIQKNKINGIIIKKPFFRRLFGIVEVQIITLGDLFDSEESQTDVLFPFINLNLASRLIEDILPDYEIKKDMNQLPAKSMFLTLIKPSYLLVIITALTFYFIPEYWFIPIIYLLFIIIKRVIEHFNSKYLVSDEFIQMQIGSFSSNLSILKKNNIDALHLNESWLQRRLHLSTIRVLTRAKPIHISAVIHMPKEIAENTYEWYAKAQHKEDFML